MDSAPTVLEGGREGMTASQGPATLEATIEARAPLPPRPEEDEVVYASRPEDMYADRATHESPPARGRGRSSMSEDFAFEAIRARVNQHAMEALREVFHRMPWDQPVTVGQQNAVIAQLRGQEEQVRDGSHFPDGHPSRDIPFFTFDVRAADGSWHIEFCVQQTGWGGVP
jgi:hypothetical protein